MRLLRLLEGGVRGGGEGEGGGRDSEKSEVMDSNGDEMG